MLKQLQAAPIVSANGQVISACYGEEVQSNVLERSVAAKSAKRGFQIV
jgi:hypothetical protein